MSLLLTNGTSNSNILSLPDEILLPITRYLLVEPRFDLKAYQGLVCLALVNTRFSMVVRSVFQERKALCVPLVSAWALFRTLRKFPAAQWADKIESLEITSFWYHQVPWENYGGDYDGYTRTSWSSSRERSIHHRLRAGLLTHEDAQLLTKMPWRRFNIEADTSFRKECLDAVQEADDVSNNNKRVWKDALRAGHTHAFLALLLLSLPNLQALLLGSGHIFHYPMMLKDADPREGPMSPQADGRIHWCSDTSTQQLRRHKYLAQVFKKSYSRLTKLEMPFSWTDISLERIQSRLLKPTYSNFYGLQTLTLPEIALPRLRYVHANGMVYSGLPESLRSLTIVDCDLFATCFARGTMHHMVLNPVTYVPKLRAISVYYSCSRDDDPEHLEPQDYARAKELGIELTQHIPQNPLTAEDVAGQPWKLSMNELDDMARLPSRDRYYRPVAGYWVGKKQGKVDQSVVQRRISRNVVAFRVFRKGRLYRDLE